MSDLLTAQESPYAFLQYLESRFLESQRAASIEHFYTHQFTSYDGASYGQSIAWFDNHSLVWLPTPRSEVVGERLPNLVTINLSVTRESDPEAFAEYDRAFPEDSQSVASLHYGLVAYVTDQGEILFQAASFEAERAWNGEDQAPIASCYVEYGQGPDNGRVILENGDASKSMAVNPGFHALIADYFLRAYDHGAEKYRQLKDGERFENGYAPQPIHREALEALRSQGPQPSVLGLG